MKKLIIIRILLIAFICSADIMVAALLIYRWKENGTLIPSTQASVDLAGILHQNLMLLVVPIVVFVVFLAFLKKDFVDQMYLRVKGKLQWSVVIALILCLCGILIRHLIVHDDKITVFFLLFYYVFVIAFAEEYVCRDACTYLLKNEKSTIRYIVPNLLFALMHIFNYSGWGAITGEYIFRFMRYDMPVILCIGCFNQALKEKTGTIWIPVLLHAAWDFALAFN